MPSVELHGIQYSLQENESVLDALLRNNIDIPHGCKAGACQSCLLSSSVETVPAAAQSGLKDTQKQLGHFLSCLCVPKNSMTVDFVDRSGAKVTTRVLNIHAAHKDIIRLRLQPVLDYQAGQYINIWIDETTIRSYSIASVAQCDDFIELHIKKIPQGVFSQQILSDLSAGQSLTIQGPLGECFYSCEDPHKTLLLAGIGTGLAPLYGIIRDALQRGHQGQITLWLGAKEASQFYLHDELEELSKQHTNFTVQRVAQDAQGDQNIIQGDIYQSLKSHHPSTKDYLVYLCGAQSFVSKMKKQCFLAGANMKDIHADIFLPCS